MSTRSASSPPLARWPFVLGDGLCFAVALTALLLGESPPGLGTMVIVFLCVAIGVGLFVTPYLRDHEDRVRLAETQARDQIETQIRRLTQTTEQLGNAISRSQSTEEQAGQALGTIEELSEKLATQADEFAQALARSQEREITALKAEVAGLIRERDERLAGLDQRLDIVTGQLSEHQLTAKKAATTSSKTLEEVKERLIALAARLDETAAHARPAAPAAPTSSAPPVPEPSASGAPVASHEDAPRSESRSAGGSTHAVVATIEAPATVAASVVAVAAKPRPRRAPETPAPAPSRISAKAQPLDLPLLDLGMTRPMVHRDAGHGTSTLVATAYIGIGNKLYVRGDGPGLSWDQGVPMQFLAIGKWGWTSAEAAEPITCRIYRNDETPMLDENIIIAPGSKAEITPRF